jgi:hypothetical protein
MQLTEIPRDNQSRHGSSKVYGWMEQRIFLATENVVDMKNMIHWFYVFHRENRANTVQKLDKTSAK